MLFSVWDTIDRIPPSHAVVAGLQRRYPTHTSWFLERMPSGYHDPDIIRADLRAAGFADCRIDTVVRTGHAVSPRGVALGLCQGSPLRSEIEALDPTGRTPPPTPRQRWWRSAAATGRSRRLYRRWLWKRADSGAGHCQPPKGEPEFRFTRMSAQGRLRSNGPSPLGPVSAPLRTKDEVSNRRQAITAFARDPYAGPFPVRGRTALAQASRVGGGRRAEPLLSDGSGCAQARTGA
jgi:hypothetical protein